MKTKDSPFAQCRSRYGLGERAELFHTVTEVSVWSAGALLSANKSTRSLQISVSIFAFLRGWNAGGIGIENRALRDSILFFSSSRPPLRLVAHRLSHTCESCKGPFRHHAQVSKNPNTLNGEFRTTYPEERVTLVQLTERMTEDFSFEQYVVPWLAQVSAHDHPSHVRRPPFSLSKTFLPHTQTHSQSFFN